MASIQLRNATDGLAYSDRKKAARKTPNEAIRALKRRLSDIVFRHVVHNAIAHTVTGRGGHRETPTNSSVTSSHPHASSSEKSLPRPATAQADLGDHLRSTVPSGRARAHVALAEAVCVAFVFNTVNRIADALGFTHRSDRGRR